MPRDDIGDRHISGDWRVYSHAFLHLGRTTLARRAAVLVADSTFRMQSTAISLDVFALAQGTRFKDEAYLSAR
jgi:hypothetical protein